MNAEELMRRMIYIQAQADEFERLSECDSKKCNFKSWDELQDITAIMMAKDKGKDET